MTRSLTHPGRRATCCAEQHQVVGRKLASEAGVAQPTDYL
jgi:hypothetical protein